MVLGDRCAPEFLEQFQTLNALFRTRIDAPLNDMRWKRSTPDCVRRIAEDFLGNNELSLLPRPHHSRSACGALDFYTGTAVFLLGLKNGISTIFAVTLCRTASIVISICTRVPSLA